MSEIFTYDQVVLILNLSHLEILSLERIMKDYVHKVKFKTLSRLSSIEVQYLNPNQTFPPPLRPPIDKMVTINNDHHFLC